ncbi:MAG: hypothetical protein ACKO8G_04860 [Actinomycetota bacterium]
MQSEPRSSNRRPALTVAGIALFAGALYGLFRTVLAVMRALAADLGVYAVRLVLERGITTAFVLWLAVVVWRSRAGDSSAPSDGSRTGTTWVAGVAFLVLAWAAFQQAGIRLADLLSCSRETSAGLPACSGGTASEVLFLLVFAAAGLGLLAGVRTVRRRLSGGVAPGR